MKLMLSTKGIWRIFDNFKKVYLRFQLGRFNGTLGCEEARMRGVQFVLLLIRGQYKMTIDHAERVFEEPRALNPTLLGMLTCACRKR